jgi:molecular chaperone DnaJ
MPSTKDYYKTLGVKRDASTDDLRKAYRRLARKYHPDLNPGDKAAEERFKEIQEANDILGDSKKRKMYDQFGFYSEQGFPGAGAPGSPGGFGFGGFDFTDAFSGAAGAAGGPRGGFEGAGAGAGAGSFSDLFSQFFGRGAGQSEAPPAPEKGTDLEYALSIDFWQSIQGAQVRIKIHRLEGCGRCRGTGSSGGGSQTCPACKGSGNVSQMAGAMRFSLTCQRCGGTGRLRNACPECRGEGRQASEESVEVRIPAGANDGSRLRVGGKGNAGTMGAPSGDLFITLRVQPHPVFRRDGDDIHIHIPVSVSEAGLGARVEVPTVDGKALLKIPQGTQNGQKFRLREKGVLNSRKGIRGDQIVDIGIQSPDIRDERTRELLKELARVDVKDPRAELWDKVQAKG